MALDTFRIGNKQTTGTNYFNEKCFIIGNFTLVMLTSKHSDWLIKIQPIKVLKAFGPMNKNEFCSLAWRKCGCPC